MIRQLGVAPVNSNDSATKSYVDSKVGGIALSALGNVTGAVALNLSTARAFSMNLTANITISLTGTLSTSVLEQFFLEIVANGFTVTWPTAFSFESSTVSGTYASDTPPTTPVFVGAQKKLLEVTTFNGGTQFGVCERIRAYG